MVTRIRKFLVLLLVVVISASIIVQNLNPIKVQITPTYTFEAVGGIVLLTVFVLGILFAAVFWLFFGVKAYFRERALQSRQRKRDEFFESFQQARNFLATREWGKALDPENTIARVELSRSLEGKEEVREALKVIDEARTVSPSNIEVLFRAADLNEQLGNKTAAIDNLALILYHHPNRLAATRARDLSEELGRIEDAIQYHRESEKLGGTDEDSQILIRLQFKKLLEDFPGNEELVVELRKFKRRHPDYAPALSTLAEIEVENGNVHEAAQLLVDAAKQSDSRAYWQQASRLWIDHNLQDRALAAAVTATRTTRGTARLNAELDLIRLHLSIGKFDEAHKAAERFGELAKEQEVEIDDELSRRLLILKGHCLNKLGKYKEAEGIWEQLSDQNFELKLPRLRVVDKKAKAQPAPRLSTP
jgi:tetratricopeptide (TPR) repeat protein